MSSPSPSPAAPAHQPAEASAGARMQWMDMLRGVAVLLVVVLHGADIPYLNGHGVEEWAEINRYLEPFRMPMLMFLSGMLLQRSLSKPLSLYAWGKWSGIGWPLLLWGLLFALFIYRGGINEPAFWRSGGDYLWFLTALVICYLIAVVLKPVVARPAFFAGGALVLFAAMLLTRHFGDFELPLFTRTLYNGAFFFLGAACTSFVLRWVRAHWAVILVFTATAVTVSYLGIEDRALRTGTLYAVPGSVLGIAVVLWLAHRVRSGRLLDALSWVGRSSIVVYIIHFPAMVLMHRLMVHLGADPILHTIVCTLTGLAVSLAAVAARPWVPWLFQFPGHFAIQQHMKKPASADVRASR